jgi:hypothetical protein
MANNCNSNERKQLMSVRHFTAVVLVVLGLLGVSLASVTPALAVGACLNEEFRIGSSSALPDCRAYELVSPVDKNGGEVDGGVGKSYMNAPEQAAGDGEAVTYGSSSSFIGTDSESAVATSQYLSTRTADGWQTRGIVPTQELPGGKATLPGEANQEFSAFQGFDEDLSAGFLLAWNPQPDPSAPVGYFNPYLFESATGGYQVLSTVVPPTWSPGFSELQSEGFGSSYAGMSADGQHVIFEANDALTEGAIPGRTNLYEWSAGQPLELVSVLPEGTVDTSGKQYVLEYGGGMLSFGSDASQGRGLQYYNYSGALSSDGKRAFWSGGEETGNQVYMHEIMESGARTVDVSASQKAGSSNAQATYWTANTEGSRVYFTSSGQLTADATAGSGSPDLYQYDVNTEELRDLSVDPQAGKSADVLGVLGMGESEGVPRVYFAARGVLAEGATAGENNLYVVRGDTGVVSFIATLGGFTSETVDYNENVMERLSRVSPSGQWLAFQSLQPLTGYDNIPAHGQPCPEPLADRTEGTEKLYQAPLEGRCTEVFEYDAQTGRLACASCNSAGLPPIGDSMVPETLHLLGNIKGWESSTVQQRYLLDDGRLFFQSEDALLPQATNGKLNVYEYEPEGVGQCAAADAGSCLYLISTGEGDGSSYFADAGVDGRDVFFLTNEALVSQDGDDVVDMYDAREGGGFSAATPPPCSGEACKPAVTPAPAIYGPPSSATFEGPASEATALVQSQVKAKSKPVKCKKGFVKKKTKCVKKPGSKKTKAKKAGEKRRAGR